MATNAKRPGRVAPPERPSPFTAFSPVKPREPGKTKTVVGEALRQAGGRKRVAAFLHPDFTAAKVALAELAALVVALPPQLRQRLLDVPEVLAKLIRFEVDPGAAGTIDMTVRAYPSDRLLELLAAMRTGNVDIDVVKQIAHGNSPSLGDSAPPSVARSGAVVMAVPDLPPVSMGCAK